MTTATRRLRRAGVAGFATIATVGGLVLTTGGTAFAALGTIANQVDPSHTATTIYPGTNAQTIGGYQLDTTNSFAIGDKIVLKIEGAGVDPSQTGKGVGFVTAPTLTASGPGTAAYGTSGGNTSDTTPTFTTALAQSNTTAGINDELVITFTNSSTGTAGDHYTLTLAPASVNVGANVGTGALNIHAYASDGTTSLVAAASVATVANSKASLTEVSAAPSTAGVALNDITLSEVTAGAFLPAGTQTTVTLTLGGVGTPLFTAGVTPTVTASSGYAVATLAATTAANTYSFKITAPATAVAATVTVKGLKVDLTAAGTGVVTLTASAAGTIGAAQNAIGVLNQARTGGVDRYATAAQLFTSGGFTGGAGKIAVIASGANYPDALSANYLAAGLNAGTGTRVLLTDPNVLPQATQQALITSQIATVYIVGGTAAVSQGVQNAIAAMHVGNNNANAFINVIRVSGADRYATNSQVDLYNGATAGVSTAIVAVGSNYADALAVAPVVVTQKYPLVLTDGGTLSAAAESTLVNLGIKNVVIVGGTSAVSANVETSIKALNGGITIAYRVAGADRTTTAQAIATWETSTGTAFPKTSAYAALNGLSLNIGQVYIARGDGFADALSAGTVAAGVGGSTVGAILLTQTPTVLGPGIPAYLGGKAANVSSLTALGLTAAVSGSVLNQAIASLS